VTKRRLSLFWYAVITLAIVYVIVKVVIPRVSMWIIHWPSPLIVPSALAVIYMLMAITGLAIYITMSEENIEEFLTPIKNFLRGDGGVPGPVRVVVLALIPLMVGWITYQRLAPKIQSATGIRIQHPTIPGQYEKLVNPYRDPSDELVKAFIEKENLGSIPIEEARTRLVQQTLVEGRGLYQRNCRPCHGSKADGNGPMGWGFRLKPANFRDPGTIPTVVEAYVFWRVNEGGRGLPNESTPWDSAMPRWKDELTADEIWKIILAEYDTADVEPRKPEKLQ
jgi:mono/diheme cytochrome c family protein